MEWHIELKTSHTQELARLVAELISREKALLRLDGMEQELARYGSSIGMRKKMSFFCCRNRVLLPNDGLLSGCQPEANIGKYLRHDTAGSSQKQSNKSTGKFLLTIETEERLTGCEIVGRLDELVESFESKADVGAAEDWASEPMIVDREACDRKVGHEIEEQKEMHQEVGQEGVGCVDIELLYYRMAVERGTIAKDMTFFRRAVASGTFGGMATRSTSSLLMRVKTRRDWITGQKPRILASSMHEVELVETTNNSFLKRPWARRINGKSVGGRLAVKRSSWKSVRWRRNEPKEGTIGVEAVELIEDD